MYTYKYECVYVLGALVKDLGIYRRRRLLSQLYHAPITRSQNLQSKYIYYIKVIYVKYVDS